METKIDGLTMTIDKHLRAANIPWPIGGPETPPAPTKEPTDGKVIASNPKYTATLDGSDDLLRCMAENLKTQDNAGTADPMFVVFQKQLVAGFESGYEDFWIWVSDDNGDYEEADADTAVVLKRLFDAGDPLIIGGRTYRRTGCTYIEKFCAAFFTQKGADDYLAWNGHNLTQPYIYVHGMYRNAEMIAVRNHFMSKGA